MKKSNQKLMLGLTILFGFIAILFLILGTTTSCRTPICFEKYNRLAYSVLFSIIFTISGIVTWAKWGSEHEHKAKHKEETEETETEVEIGKIRIKAKGKKKK